MKKFLLTLALMSMATMAFSGCLPVDDAEEVDVEGEASVLDADVVEVTAEGDVEVEVVVEDEAAEEEVADEEEAA